MQNYQPSGQFRKGIVNYSLFVRLNTKTTLGNMKCFGYVCFASEPSCSVSLASKSTYRNLFFRIPVFGIHFSESIVFGIHLFGIHFSESISFGIHFLRNPFLSESISFGIELFFGIHFFGIHFLRNPFFSKFVFFFRNSFFFGINFRHLQNREKMRISENGRVFFLCVNGADFGTHFFGAFHFGVFDFFELWGGSRLHPIFEGWFVGVGGWQLN